MAKEIYSLAGNTILTKEFSLSDQIKRASLSIAANIAEGYGRKSNKDFSRYISLSIGSQNEVITYLDFINIQFHLNISGIRSKYELLSHRLASFRKYLSSNSQPPTTNYQLSTK